MSERPILFSGEMVRAILAGRKTQTRRLVTSRTSHGGKWPVTADKVERIQPCRLRPRYVPPGWLASALDITPRVEAGDTLWVRETWRCTGWDEYDQLAIAYEADGSWQWQQPTDTASRTDDLWYQDLSMQGEADLVGAGFTPDPQGEWHRGDGAEPSANVFRKRPSIFMPRWASRLTLAVTSVRAERLRDIDEKDAIAEGIYQLVDGAFASSPDRPEGPWCLPSSAFSELWDSISGKRAPWSSNPWVWVYGFERSDA